MRGKQVATLNARSQGTENDLDANVNKAKVSCYADDSKASLKIKSESDNIALQEDLIKIFSR